MTTSANEPPLPADDEQVKEVYAYFGLAIYWTQVVEHGLVNLVVLAKASLREVTTKKDVDEVFDQEFGKTLGRILSDRLPFITFDRDLERDLQEALRIRNDLGHRYMRRNSVAFCQRRGRGEMIAELQRTRDFLMDVDRRLEGLAAEFLPRFGISREQLDEMCRKLVGDEGT